MSQPSPTLSLWQRFLSFTHPENLPPVPSAPADRFLYGLAQPVVGLRLVISDQQFFIDSLKPALLLAGFCALAAMLHLEIGGTEATQKLSFLHRFYTTFAVLAPLPSILFAAHYARLAAMAHGRLRYGGCLPRRTRLWQAAVHAVKQALVIAIALAPLLGLLKLFPVIGRAIAASLAGLWALHWVVVEAFDSARVTAIPEPDKTDGNPGSSAAENGAPVPSETTEQSVPDVWFVRPMIHLAQRLPLGKFVVRWFAGLCRFLSRPWQEEIAIAESHPMMVLGFALSTAALLATPVLNLLFRPIIVMASVALLGQLARSGASESGSADPR